jgi:hypothetical protein
MSFARGPGGVSPHHPPGDDIWADVLHVGCSHCGVLVDEKCRNTITQHVMPVPHWHRIQAAGRAS